MFPPQGATGYGTTNQGHGYEVDRSQGLVGEGYEGRGFRSVAPASGVGMGGAAVVMGQGPTGYQEQGREIGSGYGGQQREGEQGSFGGRHGGVVKEGAGPLATPVSADRVEQVAEERSAVSRLPQGATPYHGQGRDMTPGYGMQQREGYTGAVGGTHGVGSRDTTPGYDAQQGRNAGSFGGKHGVVKEGAGPLATACTC